MGRGTPGAWQGARTAPAPFLGLPARHRLLERDRLVLGGQPRTGSPARTAGMTPPLERS